MSEWIRIHAPATTSNLGAGFDIFGLALNEPYDTIEGRKIDSGIVIKEVSGPGSESIPLDPEKNSVSIAAAEVLRRTGADFGIEIKIIKGIRPGSGIGSSGASAAGGAYLAHVLTGEKLSPTEVVLCAAHAENVTSGGFHADNVAPCILGGFTIIRSYEPAGASFTKSMASQHSARCGADGPKFSATFCSASSTARAELSTESTLTAPPASA